MSRLSGNVGTRRNYLGLRSSQNTTLDNLTISRVTTNYEVSQVQTKILTGPKIVVQISICSRIRNFVQVSKGFAPTLKFLNAQLSICPRYHYISIPLLFFCYPNFCIAIDETI